MCAEIESSTSKHDKILLFSTNKSRTFLLQTYISHLRKPPKRFFFLPQTCQEKKIKIDYLIKIGVVTATGNCKQKNIHVIMSV